TLRTCSATWAHQPPLGGWGLLHQRGVSSSFCGWNIKGLFAFGVLQRQSSDEAKELMAAAQWHRDILAGIRSGDPAKACQVFLHCVLEDWKIQNQIEIDPAFIPSFPLVSRGPGP